MPKAYLDLAREGQMRRTLSVQLIMFVAPRLLCASLAAGVIGLQASGERKIPKSAPMKKSHETLAVTWTRHCCSSSVGGGGSSGAGGGSGGGGVGVGAAGDVGCSCVSNASNNNNKIQLEPSSCLQTTMPNAKHEIATTFGIC